MFHKRSTMSTNQYLYKRILLVFLATVLFMFLYMLSSSNRTCRMCVDNSFYVKSNSKSKSKSKFKETYSDKNTLHEVVNYDNGLVSIIIPSYNRYEMLLHAIDSCVKQTYKNIEIIVVDDCSTDSRYLNLPFLKFPNTKIIRLAQNSRETYKSKSAQGMTRQEGVQEAKGTWIAFLDDDDFFLPEKIEKQLAFMKKNDVLFCSTNMFFIKHNKVSADKLDFQNLGLFRPANTVPQHLTLPIIKKHNYINNSSVMLHKSIVDKAGSFRPVVFEDWDYWKRCLLYVPYCLYLDEPLVYYTTSIEGNDHQKNYSIN
jgi:teichuronic acid biosynthesis glycosyltransferase TuaG